MAKATLSINCHAFIHSKKAKCTGGQKTNAIISTAKQWCDYYGVTIKNNVAILYKGIEKNYSSTKDPNFKYTPGTKPKALDWDGGKQECGKGLHFSPHPKMTKEFITNPIHYIACPVALKDIAIHMEGQYPQKCKASHVCKPCWEVDEDGNPIKETQS